jgi:hypothetical protein
MAMEARDGSQMPAYHGRNRFGMVVIAVLRWRSAIGTTGCTVAVPLHVARVSSHLPDLQNRRAPADTRPFVQDVLKTAARARSRA